MTPMTRTPQTEAPMPSARAVSAVPATGSAKWLAAVPCDANAIFVRHLGTTGGPGGSS
jgi:hypothetical protein